MMSEKSTAIFAAALEAVLYDDQASTDLAREILARAHWVRDSGAIGAMAALSSGMVFGEPHLTRLRAEYMNKEIEQ